MRRQAFLLLLIVAMTAHAGFGQAKISIVNVTIIDGTDHLPRTNSTVIVENKKIIAITSEQEATARVENHRWYWKILNSWPLEQ